MNFDYVRDRIADARKEKGISIDEMADRLGLERRSYSRIESKSKTHKKHVDLELIEKIAKELDTDFWKLVLPDGITFTVNNHHSTAVTSLISENATVYPSAVPKELELLISELRQANADQRQFIQELVQVIKDLRSGGTDA